MRTPATALLAALLAPLAQAGDEAADKAREEAQRALNERVLAAPFNPGDVKKAQDWATEAKRNHVPPVAQPPAYWQPGWTCASLIGYAGYYYGDYRNCIYYHAYYGSYWR